MDDSTKGIGEDVQSIGGATGSSTSWGTSSFLSTFLLFFPILPSFPPSTPSNLKRERANATLEVLPQAPKLPSPTQKGASLALVALFGYDSIETHMKWRETPEHAKAIEMMGVMSREIGLKDFEVGGGGMWHVDFHSG